MNLDTIEFTDELVKGTEVAVFNTPLPLNLQITEYPFATDWQS